MLSRFSVKRPYIIVVLVIVSLILGGVSLSKMKTDLLPEMDVPYLAVITTDPGANAEKVESEVTGVIEGKLGTVSGVSNVSSISADNFSMVFMEFQDGTNMDSALVKVSSAVNEVSSQLPEGAGTPNFMEISMDMMATMYVSAYSDEYDIYKTSDLIENTVIPALERADGVADVSAVGSVERSVEVRLSDDKIEQVNNKLLANVNGKLYDAKAKIDEGKAALSKAEQQIGEQEKNLADLEKSTADELGSATAGLTSQIAALNAQKMSLVAAIQATEAMGGDATELKAQLAQLDDGLAQLQDGLAQANAGSITAASQFGSGTAQLAAAKSQIESSKSELASAEEQYKQSRETALASANIDKLVDKGTLAQLIKAQNFSMPAGYVEDGSNNQWLLRVGDEITDPKDLENLLLTNIEGVGDIRLSDVAEVTVIDNVGDAYMKVNGQPGVMLSVFKASTASTSDVSDNVTAAIADLQEDNPNLHLEVATDQGSVIDLYIRTILQSLLLGALLAIIVLAIFLRDWKPTVIVAFSIPFSVLLALLIMYFSGIGLNIMSLAGLSMAIGMLVDNSIVVLENIYRLRARGIPAPRAAVQGAKQMTGAVVASTLTTICVFVPIIFTEGLVNQMLMPFALTLTYVLTASLLVALTLVPAVGSFVFKNYTPKRNPWFEKLQDVYGKSLDFVLRHKVLPLVLAAVLLVGAVAGVLNMGVSVIPNMTSKNIAGSVLLPEDTEREAAYAIADDLSEKMTQVEGVRLVTTTDGTSTVSMLSSDVSNSVGDNLVTLLSFRVKVNDDIATDDQVRDIKAQLGQIVSDAGYESTLDEDSSGMGSMLGSGLSIQLRGNDQDKLVELSKDVMAAVDEVEGYTEIENGMEDADSELHLRIDRDKLTAAGYTVAQLYADIAGRLATSADSTELTMNESAVGVTIVDETNLMTKENLLKSEFEIANAATGETKTYKLSDFCTVEESLASSSITHSNGQIQLNVTADVEEGYNNALLFRDLQTKLDAIDVPDGYSISAGGELENINTMLEQMLLMLLVGFILIYLVMVAQFQSLLSPFIILFTVPLAFTGGFLGLLAGGEQLTMLSLMGFAMLMGTVVNNGIVFVDYANQLRIGGLEKRQALVATGRTRMRPILMTALTTILAMVPMVVSPLVGAGMQRGMALVVVGGMLYATFMTLYIVPIMYDLLYRKQPHEVDLGDESIDEDPGDAQAYLDALRGSHAEPALVPDATTLAAEGPEGASQALAEEVGFEKQQRRRWFRRG